MSEKSTFRPDLEGLRAVAVALVLLYHARVPLVTGGYVGVDVFFVLSGFLITGLLTRELTSTGRVDFAAFYARRARRLLPASALTLLVTIVASVILLPPVRVPDVAGDTIAAGFYVSNMRFAVQATDYLNSTLPPSPILHFWSLGVEEQFYLFWPAMLALVAGAAYRLGRREVGLRRIGATLAVVFVASLAFEIWLTGNSEPWAFFSLPARAWELALGGLLSLPMAATLVPRRLAPWMGWAGVALIVASGFVLNDSTLFPGLAVMLPTMGSAMVIASGLAKPKPVAAGAPSMPAVAAPVSVRERASSPRQRFASQATPIAASAVLAAPPAPTPDGSPLDRVPGPGIVLALPPMRYVGRISYSLYLWHWPILILPAAFVGSELDLPVRLLLAAASVGVAALSQRFVEDPIRHGRFVGLASRRGLAMAGALSLVVLLTSVSASAVATSRLTAKGPDVGGSTSDVPLPSSVEPTHAPLRTPAPSGGPSHAPGASDTPAPSPTPTPAPTPMPAPSAAPVPADLSPTLLAAANDLPAIYNNGCHLDFPTTALPAGCYFGNTSSSTLVVLFGDSHAAQWFPALQRAAVAQNWKLESLTKSGCSPQAITVWRPTDSRAYTECDQWRTIALNHIAAEKPELVIVSSTRAYELAINGQAADVQDHLDLWAKALNKTLGRLAASAGQVVLLGDTPRSVGDPVACLSQHMDDVTACAVPFSQAVDQNMLALNEQAAAAKGVDFIDPTAWVCRTDPCVPVFGRFLIYRDQGHMTKTYASALSKPLAAALPELP
jgi:peptidoglycan/LPS O-acetylase OafA/YrhL